ncbi:MAG TPA: biopolymer transporter ExbD [Planctomycetota bacterium]|jgi:biopolymer transport protein ExbD
MKQQQMLHITVPMVSLGDIAFLLITFFIMSTNFVKESQIKLDPAAAPNIAKLKETVLSVQVDKVGTIFLRGKACSLLELESTVQLLAQDLEEKAVTLTVDKDVHQDVYGPIFLALSRAGVEILLAGHEEPARAEGNASAKRAGEL